MNEGKTYSQIAGQKIGRIEALSDGVFSIAMTLLVLDLRVPVSNAIQTEGDLFISLCNLFPKLITYFMSFLTLGIFWTGHSTQFNYIHKSDRNLNWISIFFLMVVSLLPFTTAFLGEHIHFKLSIGLYWLNIFLLGVLVFISWTYADAHHYVSLEGQEKEAVSKAIKTRVIIAQILYACGALLCFIHVYLSIIVIVAIQLNYAFGLITRLSRPRPK